MQKILTAFLFAMTVFGLAADRAIAQSNSCSTLKQFAAPGVTIESSEPVAAGGIDANQNPALPPLPKSWKLPAYCRVHGVIHARTGSDGNSYGIHFELRMPDGWKGKLFFQGGGGTDGVVQPALGLVNFKDAPALARGFAVVTEDSGHQGAANIAFGNEQQARLDYAYNAIGEVARTAKLIIAAYYQKPASRSYFVGCSNGGREAMMATQRFPLEFDGAIAGDPGFHLSHAAIAEAWDTETFNSAAPTDAQKRPILSRSLSPDDLSLVAHAVLQSCDELDGVRDGEINNFQACHFDPEVLVCKGEKTAQCLNRQQVDVLKESFAGAHDSKGNKLYSGWPWDAGIGDMGWRVWKLGTSETSQPNGISATFGLMALSGYFVHPQVPSLNLEHVDFDRISAQVDDTYKINDATSTDLSTFAAHGGKLLLYEGLSDPVFSASDLIEYYEQFLAANGGQEKARGIARLFLVPGMTHCGGGPATDEFDPLSALEHWVEDGIAPESITATGRAFPNRTRPLCAYPQYAAYTGKGNPEDAASFACK
jgi:feruloyl esterase